MPSPAHTRPTGSSGERRAAGFEEVAVPALVLIVDDDESIRTVLSHLLEGAGHPVLAAASTREAKALLQQHPVGLVVSDVVMPGESGIELRRALARERPALPVILMSGYSADGPAEFAARNERTSFVQKPFAAEEMLALVSAALSPPAGRSLAI